MSTRTLTDADAPALEAFLQGHAETSMFLRSNARAAGLSYRPAPYHGVYVARFEDGIVAAAAHYWNGMLMVQAPELHVAEVAAAAVRASGRPVHGLSGAWSTCVAARTALGLDAAPTLKCDREELFSLALDELVVPPSLERGELRCRLGRADELDELTGWRVDYCLETLGAEDGPKLRAEARASVERALASDTLFVLETSDARVATSTFNAQLPDTVQIGGVWTPPSLRGRGYARSVVAGSLLHARSRGVRRSLLFTGETNEAARRAYLSIGYRVIGDYALILFAMPA